MSRFTKGLFAALLSFAFLARGAAALCPPSLSEHGCCDASAPQAPCSEMSCCRAAPATAAPTLATFAEFFAYVNVDVAVSAPETSFFVVPTFSDCGPPGAVALSVSGRSPPALLG